MKLYNSPTYSNNLENEISGIIDAHKLIDRSILITGASGLLGSYIVDLLLTFNRVYNANIKIYALGRCKKRLEERFINNDNLIFIESDVTNPPNYQFCFDYIVHAASPAFPASFVADPVGTIMSNIQGLKYLLDYGRTHKCKKVLYISSGEVYGQGDLSLDAFSEDYSGYVNPISPRSCYPNSKRAAETLCVSYEKQFGLETTIVRPCHSYGPNATAQDNRANVQFVNNAILGKNIVLKSSGNQMRSYCYVADASTAILSVLLAGKSGEAYNIANFNSRITIAGFAQKVAEKTGVTVIFENPDEIAISERSPISKQVLDSSKLESLGWFGKYDIDLGIENTIKIIKELR